MKSPSDNQLYEYSQKCGEDGHNSLQKIMLIESANLGYWKALDLAKHEGIEIRRLARYEKRLIKSLKSEIHEYSASKLTPNIHKQKKIVSSARRKTYNEEAQEFKSIVAVVSVVVVMGLFVWFVAYRVNNPTPLTPEQSEDSLYDAWQSAKSNRDYWYKAAEKRYNKDGEISSAFKKYLEADRAVDAAWKRYRDYSSSLEARGGQPEDASEGASSASANKQSGVAVPSIRTHGDHLSQSETERKALTNRKALEKTFEESKTENVREAQRRLGLMIDSMHEELGYDLDKSDIETIDEDYSNAISLLDNGAKSIKQKISAIKAASEAHSLYMKHKRMHPNIDEDEKRNGDEILKLNEIKTGIYAKSSDLLRRLKGLDKDFYSHNDLDATNSLRILTTKERGMPSDSFRMFSFHIDEEHGLSELFGKGLIYMPYITPRIKQDEVLRSELFAFMISEPEKQVGQLQRELSKLKRTQDYHNSYRAESKRLRNEYELIHSVYPLDLAQLEELPTMESDLANELAKIKEWKGALHQSNDLVRLIQKAEEPKPVANQSYGKPKTASAVTSYKSSSGSKFTSYSTGHDWNRASTEYKKEYCQLMARTMQDLAPGIGWKIYYDSLNEFYRTSDSQLLNEKITDMIGLTTGVWVNGGL